MVDDEQKVLIKLQTVNIWVSYLCGWEKNCADIKMRITLAKEVFAKKNDLLTKQISRIMKKRLVMVLVWTAELLYDMDLENGH